MQNNPVNRIDPTGNVDCLLLGDQNDTFSCNTAKTIRANAGSLLTPCNNACQTTGDFGNMQRAHDVFLAVEKELGRPLTYEEILAFLAHHEFGKQLYLDEEYDIALEAEGRQFYNFCGSDGLCRGDELWKFLGGHDSWTANNPIGIAAELMDGDNSIDPRDWAGAQRILNQPFYDPSTATLDQKLSNWRSGANVDGVPFVYGNYSMFRDISFETLKARGIDGINGNALSTTYLNKPDINGVGGNGYVVMTIGQKNCTLGLGPCAVNK